MIIGKSFVQAGEYTLNTANIAYYVTVRERGYVDSTIIHFIASLETVTLTGKDQQAFLKAMITLTDNRNTEAGIATA